MSRRARPDGAEIRVGCLALAWLFVAALALSGCRNDPQDPSAVVDALLSENRTDPAPGTSVIIIRDGAVLKRANHGLANLESGAPIESDTAFRLGSISKQFTAMAIMMLEEQGKLDYDDRVTRFLPELERIGSGVTIRNLLNHTAGLPDYYDVLVEVTGVARPHTRHGLDAYAAWGDPLFAPGERYEYSNPGYELLALIVEAASGEIFGEFVEARIFRPLGMMDSVVFDARLPEMAKRAYGYSRTESGFGIDDDDPLNFIIGSGGIYSTVEDLYLWDQALYGEQLVRAGTLAAAFSPTRLNGGEDYPYGFGWGLEDHLARRRVSHSGSWVGFHNYISRYPDDAFTVVVLSNLAETDVEALANAIAAAYLVDEPSLHASNVKGEGGEE